MKAPAWVRGWLTTFMIDLPISDSITMRPVWRRRQLRHYFNMKPKPPTEREIQDAIRVLADPENQLYAPALHLEAFMILDEAGRKDDV